MIRLSSFLESTPRHGVVGAMTAFDHAAGGTRRVILDALDVAGPSLFLYVQISASMLSNYVMIHTATQSLSILTLDFF